jgi:predicted DNA-binding transcriptional regulator AlpA
VAKKLSRRKEEPQPEEDIPPSPLAEAANDHVGTVILEVPGTSAEPILYNTDDACFMLGKISKPMLYRLITTKKLHPIKLGSRSMFTKAELLRYIKECEEEQPA